MVCAAEAKADAVLVTALDETAWLFNMRGGDVDYNPIFVSYGLVTAKEATLFVDAAKARPRVFAAVWHTQCRRNASPLTPKLSWSALPGSHHSVCSADAAHGQQRSSRVPEGGVSHLQWLC